MKKHFWTILLVLCMALCLIPTPAVYASDFNGWTKLTDEYSGKSLESGNYYLDSDVTLSDMITILENKTVTIDLNGHVLKKAGGTLLFLEAGSKVYNGDDISYTPGAKLTIQDSNPNSAHDDSAVPVGGAILGAEIDTGFGYNDQSAVFINMTGGTFSNGASLEVYNKNYFVISGTARFENNAALTNEGKMYANGGRVDCEVSNRGTICNTASSITSFYGEIKNTGDRAVVSGGIYYGTLADGMTAGKTVTYKNGDAVFAVQIVPSGGRATSLEAPGNTGNVFTGWRKADGTGFDFSTAVTEDLTLTAGWLDPSSVGEKGDKGDKGDKGEKGDKGDKGDSGDNGAAGQDGVTPQLKVGEDNCWYVSYDNGQTWTSLNVKATGDKGDTGEKGETGLIPYIGDNGNWWLGDADTGVQASVKGDTGEAGSDGKDGAKGDAGVSGTDGKNGADGIGIDKININENGELIINLTNGTAINLGKVTGDDGKDGEDGLTPYIGDNGNWWIGDKDTGVQAEASVSIGNSPVIIIIGVVAGLALLGCIVLSVILYNVLKKKTGLI